MEPIILHYFRRVIDGGEPMLREKIQQVSFHNVLWEILLPQDHELLRIKNQFNFSWVDEELKSYYKESSQGRPSFPPRSMFLMLFLEIYDNLSDYEVAERTRRDALYRNFVGFELEDDIPDHSTLSFFRERLGEEGFEKIFNRFVEELERQHLISHKLKIVDATHTQSNSKVRSRVGILRQAQRKILSSMKKEDIVKLKELFPTEPYVNDPKPGEEQNSTLLGKEVEKLKELLALAKGRFEKEALREAETIEDLLFNAENPIGSITDTDARFGHKSKGKQFHGYKIHTVTNESEIVTSVETLPGNTMESQDLPRLLKAEKDRGIEGEIAVADSLYVRGENRKAIREELGMQEVIPSDKRKVQAEFFQYDPKTDRMTCPQGKSSLQGSPHATADGKIFFFSKKDCGVCPLQDQCPSFSKRERRARVLLSLDRQMRLSSSLSPKTQKALYKFRTIVERIYGKGKMWHGLAQARYRSRWRVAIQSFLTFFVLNAKKALRIKEGLCPLKPPGLAILGYG